MLAKTKVFMKLLAKSEGKRGVSSGQGVGPRVGNGIDPNLLL